MTVFFIWSGSDSITMAQLRFPWVNPLKFNFCLSLFAQLSTYSKLLSSSGVFRRTKFCVNHLIFISSPRICGPCRGSHWSRHATIQGLWISDLEALARGKTGASMVWKSWLSQGLRGRLSKLCQPGRSKWPLLTHVNWCDYFWFGILLLFRWLVCILLLHLCRSESSNKSCWDPWRHAPICEPTNLWANRSV